MSRNSVKMISYVLIGFTVVIFILNFIPIRLPFFPDIINDKDFMGFATFYMRSFFLSSFISLFIVSLVLYLTIKDEGLKKLYMMNMVLTVLGAITSILIMIYSITRFFTMF